MEEGEKNPQIIIDNGSGYSKVGLNGEEEPRYFFPSCVGYPKYLSHMPNGRNFYVGSDALAKRGILNLNYPINHGVVDNWGDMEKIWDYSFVNLHRAPEEHNIMLTEPILNPKENREIMAEIMFETFNVSGLYIKDSPSLCLYCAGKFSGIVVESGESVTQIVPIWDLHSILPGINRLNYGGKNLTKILEKSLKESVENYLHPSWIDIVKSIKEKACYVALDYKEEIKNVEPYDYELPDGHHCIIKNERIKCTEALFNPSFFSNDDDKLNIKSDKESNILEKDKGLGYACFDSIKKCEIDVRKDLYNCIVLCGGNSMFNGLPERLTKEIKMLAPESMKEEVKVISSPERKFAAWIGGSILSTISTFKTMWITKAEYEESGVTIVHKKIH